ncbi:MAG: hypothetical protein EXS08_00065 [Planctomycetes bacterium]|nr:hypothetical protein [Planctomycetota bacterium]
MVTVLDFRSLSAGLAWFAALLAPATESPRPSCALAPVGAQDEFASALAKEGIVLHREAGVLSIPVAVQVKSELLEYLVVGPNGAAHESLFLTPVRPSILNTALLLLGVEPGRNAHFEERPGADELGRPNKQIYPPAGDGFYLYVAWRERAEVYFFRLEDLLRNLESGRSLARHRFVYLGSRFAALKKDAPETFVADVEGNLINLAYFFQSNTLLTAVPEECYAQTIWAANEWLLPAQGEGVRLYFARRPLAQLEPAWLAELPVAGAGSTPTDPAPKDDASKDAK